MVIGGVAVIALGVPRLTVNIAATVAASALSIERVRDRCLWASTRRLVHLLDKTRPPE